MVGGFRSGSGGWCANAVYVPTVDGGRSRRAHGSQERLGATSILLMSEKKGGGGQPRAVQWSKQTQRAKHWHRHGIRVIFTRQVGEITATSGESVVCGFVAGKQYQGRWS